MKTPKTTTYMEILKNLRFIFLPMIAMAFWSCEHGDLTNETDGGHKVADEKSFTGAISKNDDEQIGNNSCIRYSDEPNYWSDHDGTIVLAQERVIPQSIVIMETAWNNIQGRGLFSGIKNPVRVNRLYVRFFPENRNQMLELAHFDASLDLFDFPLHYDFEPTTNSNDCYRDRELPDDGIGPLYTVVDNDYVFPDNVSYEIIQELYMPHEDKDIDESLVEVLELEAERIALVLEGKQISHSDKKTTIEGKLASKGWRPEGRIRVVNYSNGETIDGQPVPVPGVHVLARSGLKWSWGITDEFGEFRVKKEFKKEVNYSIRWSNHEWYIIKGSGVTRAWHFGPKKEGVWDELIDGTIQSFYAVIHRAAYLSFYGENYGTTRPMHNKPGNDRIWIRAFNRASKNRKVYGYFYDTAPHTIGIFAKDGDNEWIMGEDYDKNHHQLFWNTLHEFGHASHRNLCYIDNQLKWYKSDLFVKESWANGTAMEMAKDLYPRLHNDILKRNECLLQSRPDYTFVVKDLLYPNGANVGFNPANPNFQPHFAEFSLKNIEDALGHKWNDWKDNLKLGLPKAKADNLEGMFDHWYTVCD